MSLNPYTKQELLKLLNVLPYVSEVCCNNTTVNILLNKGLDNQAKLCIDVISNVENALMQALLKLTK